MKRYTIKLLVLVLVILLVYISLLYYYSYPTHGRVKVLTDNQLAGKFRYKRWKEFLNREKNSYGNQYKTTI